VWLSGCAATAPQNQSLAQYDRPMVRNATLLIGQRSLEKDDDWDPADDQLLLGLQIDWYDPDWWYHDDRALGYELGLFYSNDDDDVNIPGVGSIDVEATTAEFSFGGRFTLHFERFRLHPYVGAGAAVIWAEADPASGTSGDSEDDWSPGAYAHAGVYWNAWRELMLGFDYRILMLTDVDVGIDTDVDYQQLAFTLGFGF
jgi:opacity protein-like surface antigen